MSSSPARRRLRLGEVAPCGRILNSGGISASNIVMHLIVRLLRLSVMICIAQWCTFLPGGKQQRPMLFQDCCVIAPIERQLGECSCFIWVLIVRILSLVVLTVDRTTLNHGTSNLDPTFTLQKLAIFTHPKINPEPQFCKTSFLQKTLEWIFLNQLVKATFPYRSLLSHEKNVEAFFICT